MTLPHGVKEKLVSSPLDWPGLHCAKELVQENPIVEGHWDDLTKKYRLENAGKTATTEDIRSEECLQLDVLPCWHDHDPEWVREWVLARVAEIVEEYSEQAVLGAAKVLTRPVSATPKKAKRSYAVDFHVRDPVLKKEWRTVYREFVGAFRQACRYFHESTDECGFPPGCFPPNAPFIPETA